jgi:hypothetical protein
MNDRVHKNLFGSARYKNHTMKKLSFYLIYLLLIQVAAKTQVKIGDNSTSINNAFLL